MAKKMTTEEKMYKAAEKWCKEDVNGRHILILTVQDDEVSTNILGYEKMIGLALAKILHENNSLAHTYHNALHFINEVASQVQQKGGMA